MTQTISYKNKKISYSTYGQGNALVFLHGYLESKEIFDDFAPRFADDYSIVLIDLFGHGHSTYLPQNITEMAEAVLAVLDHLHIKKSFWIGHSMGGYVAMAALANFSDRLFGLCLLHSAPFADTEEKKINRDREIALIHAGKKAQIYQNHVPNTFAKQNIDAFSFEIERAKTIAKNTDNKGIIAALQAMRNRADGALVLQNTKLPFIYVLGLKDNFIPDTIMDKIKFPQHSIKIILEQSGHNGFIEEAENCYSEIKTALRSSTFLL